MNKTFKCIVLNESAADFQHNGIQNLLFRQIKGSTTLSETEFRKIMKAIADYLKMLKLYEQIFCDSGKNSFIYLLLKLSCSYILLYHARTTVSRYWNAKICKKCFKPFVFPSKETSRRSIVAYDFGRWQIWKHCQGLSFFYIFPLFSWKFVNGDWYLWLNECSLTNSFNHWFTIIFWLIWLKILTT